MARFLIQLVKTVYEVVITGDTGQLPEKTAGKPQNRIHKKLPDPFIQRISQTHHQNKGTKDCGLVL
jgi:hypothetical protein